MRNTGKVTRLLLLQLVEAGEPTAPLNDLASSHGDHEDDRSVNASTQRRPMPVCPAERSGQPGEKRQGRDRVDRREEGRKILANLDQERRHMSERVFYPDTNDVSSTSKVVALSIARDRTRELILSDSRF